VTAPASKRRYRAPQLPSAPDDSWEDTGRLSSGVTPRPYLEQYWTSVVGPSSVLLLRQVPWLEPCGHHGGVESQPRIARIADIPGIRECYLRSWRAAYDSDLSPDVLDLEAEKRRAFDWAGGITADTSAVFVVTNEAGVVGVVQADESLPAPRNRPEITMLYVDPAAWGSGAAAELLHAGLRWIGNRGHNEARLRVVEAHLRARRFYEREGWVVDPDREPARNDFFKLIYYRRAVRG
jgi:GNAT superfamily N-acetyltransferase